MITGASLLGAETACSILAATTLPETPGEPGLRRFVPVALPLFGVYAGNGVLCDIPPGRNAELIVAAFLRFLAVGTVQVDWTRLDIERPELDHAETLLSLLTLAHVHAPEAITCSGYPLSLAFYSAHVAAQFMDPDPARLSDSTALEDLAGTVFHDHPLSLGIYAGLRQAPIKLRCRFGLMFASQAALDEQLELRQISWRPPSPAVPAEHAPREQWLDAALSRARGDELLLAGLADYLAQAEDALDEEELLADDGEDGTSTKTMPTD